MRSIHVCAQPMASYSRVHLDHGGEFRSRKVRSWAEEQSLVLTFSSVAEPQSNGTAESAIGLLKRLSRTLLSSAGLGADYWKFAFSYATTLENHARDKRALPAWAPEFGALVVGILPGDSYRKLWLNRGVASRFVGLEDGSTHTAQVVDSSGRLRLFSTIRKVGSGWSRPEEPLKSESPKDVYDCPACRGRRVAHTWKRGCEKFKAELSACVAQQNGGADSDLSGESELPGCEVSASMIPVKASDVLKMSGVELEEWKESLRAELAKQLDKGLRVATAAEKAKVRPLPMLAVLGEKPRQRADVDGRKFGFMEKKARVVVCGQFEKGNLNPTQTTQVHTNTIRTSVAIAARRRWKGAVVDVAGAFLNNELPEEDQIPGRLPRIYQLLGICEEMDYVTTPSVYGRRTSPREWSSKRDKDIVDKVVGQVGKKTHVLKRSCSDPDAWLVKCGSKVVGIAMTYVDDFLILTEDEVLQPLIDALNSCWTLGSIHKLVPGGDVKYCGFNIRMITNTKTNKCYYTLDQEDYVADLLRRRRERGEDSERRG
jgi:hypothetical protein